MCSNVLHGCSAAMGVNPDDHKEVKEETSKSGKQMEDSRLRLTKLRDDGMELVTNIRVAGDAREQIRRGEEEESKRQRLGSMYNFHAIHCGLGIIYPTRGTCTAG